MSSTSAADLFIALLVDDAATEGEGALEMIVGTRKVRSENMMEMDDRILKVYSWDYCTRGIDQDAPPMQYTLHQLPLPLLLSINRRGNVVLATSSSSVL